MKGLLKLCSVAFSSLIALNTSALTEVKVGVESINYYPIYGTFDAEDKSTNGEYVGYIAELFNLFNKSQSDYKLVPSPYPVKRLYAEYLTNKNVDAKFPDNADWNPNDVKNGVTIHYSAPVLSFSDSSFVKKEREGQVTKDNMSKLGSVAGFTPFSYLDKIKSKNNPSGNIEFVEFSNVSGLLQRAISSDIDVIFLNEDVVTWKLEKMNKNGALVPDASLPSYKSNYHLSSTKHEGLISAFNNFLVEKDKDISKLKEQFGLK